ncbi:hypothetical protein CVT24_010798 [Panaeolus cyanescens]|uniref:NAD(P)-binding domain-containing protein n=1 Tax=Panaeolus cyanescens TaxID=181874 RepID=A0A409VGW0_9AGAR|nr:hypothetical protein CVT24_010798 [Panaeolus cyanescens]
MADSTNLNILVIGGSRNIGYDAALRFLNNTRSTVTYLLRNPSVFDEDVNVQKHVQSGQARLVKGNALYPEDVSTLWAEATKERPVDVLLFTVGFTGDPKFHPLKGFVIEPPDLVTKSLLNVLCTMPKTGKLPKIITLSTLGVTRGSRSASPFLLSPVYGWLITPAVNDKLGMERVIAHCSGWDWNPKNGEPSDEIMGRNWQAREGLPAPGSLKGLACVIRASMLTDGNAIADTPNAKKGLIKPYRAAVGDISGYRISRKDVGHFVYETIMRKWEDFGGKQVSVTY